MEQEKNEQWRNGKRVFAMLSHTLTFYILGHDILCVK